MPRIEGIKPTNNIWLFCEGETEKYYFQKFKALERIPRFVLKVKTSRRTDATGLVEYVIRFKKSNLRDFQKDDLIYCIFDRNSNTNIKLKKATDMAKESGIEIIFSNPCFEYWILCHFESMLTICEFDEIKIKIETHMRSRYIKGDRQIYVKTRDKKEHAVRNSKKAVEKHQNKKIKLISIESNPSTLVHELIEKFNEIKESDID